MAKNIKELGFYDCETIVILQEKENFIAIDCTEGVLIDSLLLYDNKTDIYYICQEHVLNEWSSLYKVYCGEEKNVMSKWEKIKNSETGKE